MTREMHDACNEADIVRTPGVLIAGYSDGRCAASWNGKQADVLISSVQTDSGTIGDCEPRNGTVAGWISWVWRRRSAGIDPSLYVADDSLSPFFDGYKWSQVRTQFDNAGVLQPHWWICKPGYTQIPDGAMGVQAGLDIPPGYDYSVVADFWPGVDGEDMSLDPNDPTVKQILADLDSIRNTVGQVFNIEDWGTPVGGAAPQGWLPTQVQEIKDAIAKLSTVTGADPTALADAVAKVLGTKLSS